jgi:2-isopropylmalate synthase
MCGVPLPHNYPVVGDDAFRTGTGVHAAAIIKAMKTGDRWVEDAVYSGVPASLVGLEQVIEISPVSGLSNVRFWLAKNGHDAEDGELCDAVFALAKRCNRTLTRSEIEAEIEMSLEARS